jgi:hypothetical protein
VLNAIYEADFLGCLDADEPDRNRWLPPVRVMRPLPDRRFAATHPRSDPSAAIPHAGICARAARKGGPYRDLRHFRFPVHDLAGQFTGSFDTVLAGAGIEAARIPPPKLSRERLFGEICAHRPDEATNWMLIFGERHLRLVQAAYAAHYNGRRPHRSRELRPPRPITLSTTSPGSGQAPTCSRRPHQRIRAVA